MFEDVTDAFIDYDAMMSVIKEASHEIQIYTEHPVAPKSPTRGIPAQRSLQSKKIRGYVVRADASWISIAGGNLATGGWTLYAPADELSIEEMTAYSFAVYRGQVYSMQLQLPIEHRGLVYLLQINLTPARNMQAIPGSIPNLSSTALPPKTSLIPPVEVISNQPKPVLTTPGISDRSPAIDPENPPPPEPLEEEPENDNSLPGQRIEIPGLDIPSPIQPEEIIITPVIDPMADWNS